MDRHWAHSWVAPSLQPGLCNDPARVHGLSQGLVVALILVGIGTGEVGDGPVEDVAVAEVGRDGNSVTRAGVGAGEGRRTDPRVQRHHRGAHRVDVRRALPVAQLPDVGIPCLPVMPVNRSQPRKMSLAACIRRCPATTRWPLLAYWLLPTNRSNTDSWASLACRN